MVSTCYLDQQSIDTTTPAGKLSQITGAFAEFERSTMPKHSPSWGVAAFFTGVMRAPVTGIVLVTEMTGNVAMLLPMLGVSFLAMLGPTLVRKPTNLPLVTRAYAAPRNDKPDESRKEQGGDQE